MSAHVLREEVLTKLERPLPPLLRPVLALLALVGIAAFIVMATGTGAARAWRIYHVNWLFWSGLSQAGVVFAASQIVTEARWSHPIRRMAEAAGAFLPISFVLFLVLWIGRAEVFPWIRHPITDPPVKAFWLRDGFLFGRDIVLLLILYGLSAWFLYHSLRPDVARLPVGSARRGAFPSWLARGWGVARTEEADLAHSVARLARLGPGLIVAYALTWTLLAFDLVMSLAPQWYSNLLGAYSFMAAWLQALMALALLVIFWRRHLGLQDLVTPSTFHDLGKLCFAFTAFWGYLTFGQYLVIWYGNMGEETHFPRLRLIQPWVGLTVTVLFLMFVIPFFGLLSRAAKVWLPTFFTFAVGSLVGLWMLRYLEVYPSLHGVPARAPFGLWEVGVTAGMLGLWMFAYSRFMTAFPRMRIVMMTSPYRDEVQVPVNPETMEPLPAHE